MAKSAPNLKDGSAFDQKMEDQGPADAGCGQLLRPCVQRQLKAHFMLESG
jgi:hypothetical protein